MSVVLRRAAHDHAASPDRLDVLTPIVPPVTWWRARIALAAARAVTAKLREGTRRLLRVRAASRVVRTPTVLQMEAVECGAASLAMVLAHHGRWVPLDRLRMETGVSRDGTKASNIIKIAQRYGLNAKGFRKELDQLPSLPLPFIVFWQFNHFLVVEGIEDDGYHVNDPATGARFVSRQEFDRSFTGVVLVMSPGENFRPGGAPPRLRRLLARRLRGAWGGLAFALVSSALVVTSGLIVPVVLRRFVDGYLATSTRGDPWPLVTGLVIAVAVASTLTWVRGVFLVRFGNLLAVESSQRFFRHVLHLPMRFFSQRLGGEIASRIPMNDHVAAMLSGDLAGAALDATLVVFLLGLMLVMDVRLALVALVAMAVTALLFRVVAARRGGASRDVLRTHGMLVGITLWGIQAIETLKASGRESEYFARWAGIQARVTDAEQQLDAADRVLGAGPSLIAALATAVVLVLGSSRVLDGATTVGALVAFVAVMRMALEPIERLVEVGGKLQEAHSQMQRLDDVLEHDTDPLVAMAGHSEPTEHASLTGAVELRDVTFGYSPLDPPLVRGFNLTLRAGERVAIVGPSGSGKSTISRLLSGLLDPWEGEVLFDGRPRVLVPRPLLARSVAYVDQQIALFAGTVRENLTLWDERVPQDLVVAAARRACIHDDIMSRAGGYDAVVAEGGRNFSGGQRQRLEIARALVGAPKILAMDEATSALDPIVEERFQANLAELRCTCLIVAHRLSTVRDCDRILVMKDGAVVEEGTHAALMAQGGVYAGLVSSD